MEDTTYQPMFAELDTTNETATGVNIIIFDKEARLFFSGANHRDVAARVAEEWNVHLDKEWANMGKTTALIMQRFIDILGSLGVAQETIEEAMKAVPITDGK